MQHSRWSTNFLHILSLAVEINFLLYDAIELRLHFNIAFQFFYFSTNYVTLTYQQQIMSYINKRKEIFLSSTSIVNYFINYSTLEVHAFNFTYLDVGKEKSHHKTYFATSTNSQFFYLMINVVYFLFSTSQSTYYVLRDRHKNMFLRMGRI